MKTHEASGFSAASEDSLAKAEDKRMGRTLGRLSLTSYLLAASASVWLFLLPDWWWMIFLHAAVVSLLGFFVDRRFYDVWWRASFLGSGFSLGLAFSLEGGWLYPLGCYVVLLSAFHYLEYLVTALTNPSNLATDSFLLNHSLAYGIAVVASLCEFFFEAWMLPGIKQNPNVCRFGVVACVVGDGLRKTAMFHAGRNFNHIVQSHKSDCHQLVTSGVFSLFRHPSYVGWFLWSVSTQLVLCNPVCCIAYCIVSWNFFSERIAIEEYALVDFFGQAYLDYQKRVPVGIPFIKGFHQDEADKDE